MIEVNEVEHFIELYRKYRINGVLTQDIVIKKKERFFVYDMKQFEEIKKFFLRRTFYDIIGELMFAMAEFPMDTFCIKCSDTVEQTPNTTKNKIASEIIVSAQVWVLRR